MTGSPQDDFRFPTRRWLVWGVFAVAVLAAVILLINWLTADDDAGSETSAEQMEWSIELVDFTGDLVTLKGDLPLGFPTETWQNDLRIARAVNGDFVWDLDVELPVDVVAADDAGGCDELNLLLAGIAESVGEALEPQLWQARAFAQHTINVMGDQGCTVDEGLISNL